MRRKTAYRKTVVIRKTLILVLMWILGLVSWFAATRDLARLPGAVDATQSFIVQGHTLTEITQAVEDVGGEVTHDLGIIRAVGARLTLAQRDALARHGDVRRIYEDRQARIAAEQLPTALAVADQDAWLSEASPSLDSSSAAELLVDRQPGDEKRAIFRFDLSVLPQDVLIISATARFWVTRGGNPHPVDVHRVTDAWSEGGVSWSSSGDAIDPAPDASLVPSGVGAFAEADVTSLTQAWISGLLPHHGLMLVGTTEQQESRFASRDWPDPSQHPHLEIRYIIDGSGGSGGGSGNLWTVEDRFGTVSFGNDDGTRSWAGDWREIGERDGPRSGKVAVAAFDGSRQGLRIQHKRKGAEREVDLSGLTHAVLSFETWRDGLDAEGDKGRDRDSDWVAVQVSADGGASFGEVGRIAGPGDDSEPQQRIYDLSGHLSASTILRFMSSRTLKNGEKVYIDNVQIGGNDEIFGAGRGPAEAPPYSDYPALVEAAPLHAQGLTGAGVTVAIIDSGLWPWHSLLLDTSGQPRRVVRYDAVLDQLHAGGDANGHGTHVASIALSSAEPLGQSGVYNGIAPDAGLVAVRAFDQHGQGTYSSIIRGLDWVVEHRDALGIRVLNLSFSAPLRSYYWEDPLNQAVMAAWQAGIVVVASAGNRGPDAMTIGVPGNVPYIVTVGAMTDAFTPNDPTDDRLAFFSSAGPTVEAFVKPEIVAPGGHMQGVLDPGSLVALQHPERLAGDSFTMSGTSQSAAVVSGIAALLLEAEPWLTPDELKCRLMDSGRAAADASNELVYSPFQQGAGLISAAGALASDELTCANLGLDVTSDLDGATHYAGAARWDPTQGYYIEGVGYAWDGTFSPEAAPWTDATPWFDSDSSTDATPWFDGSPWTDATPWFDSDSWTDGAPWIDATPWFDVAHVWSNELGEMSSVNLWVEEE